MSLFPSFDRPALRMLAMSRVVPEYTPVEDSSQSVKLKLSFLDVAFIARPPIQHVFLYKLASPDEFPSAVRRLEESLASCLAFCLPLAGKLVYDEGNGDVVVDCSDAGVPFFVAEVDGGCMDVHRLVREEAMDLPKYLSLVPEFDGRVLPAPVFSVQATWLGADGGMALVASVHHAVLDGRGIERFIDLWATASRGSILMGRSPYYYSRKAISIAQPRSNEVAREILRKVAPTLPVANTTDYYLSLRPGLAWQRFCLSSQDIWLLKETIRKLASSEARTSHAPIRTSTFVAVSALCWTAFVWAKGLAPEDDTYFAFPADLRTRLHPPMGDGYLGVCIKKCLASSNAGDLLGDTGLLRASRAIQDAVREAAAAPLEGTDFSWKERVKHVPLDRLVAVAGDPKMEMYKIGDDFGFGKPVLTDYMPLNQDGRIALNAGMRDREVQISVTLDQARMDTFKAFVTGGPRARI